MDGHEGGGRARLVAALLAQARDLAVVVDLETLTTGQTQSRIKNADIS